MNPPADAGNWGWKEVIWNHPGRVRPQAAGDEEEWNDWNNNSHTAIPVQQQEEQWQPQLFLTHNMQPVVATAASCQLSRQHHSSAGCSTDSSNNNSQLPAAGVVNAPSLPFYHGGIRSRNNHNLNALTAPQFRNDCGNSVVYHHHHQQQQQQHQRQLLELVGTQQGSQGAGDARFDSEYNNVNLNAHLGLNLVTRPYFPAAVHENSALVLDHMGRRPSRPYSLTSSRVPVCQAENCKADLRLAKHYHRRHKVCEFHSKATTVFVSGSTQRFCQQCSRFHALSEFDEGKRSCRKRLEDHNRRRRKPRPPGSATATLINAEREISQQQSKNAAVQDLAVAKQADKQVDKQAFISLAPTSGSPLPAHRMKIKSEGELMCNEESQLSNPRLLFLSATPRVEGHSNNSSSSNNTRGLDLAIVSNCSKQQQQQHGSSSFSINSGFPSMVNITQESSMSSNGHFMWERSAPSRLHCLPHSSQIIPPLNKDDDCDDNDNKQDYCLAMNGICRAGATASSKPS